MTVDDRAKLPLSFDTKRMQEEVLGLTLHDFIHYSVLPLTSPVPIVDPSLGRPAPVDNYADGSWAEWPDTPLLESCSYLSSIVEEFLSHTTVTLVRLLRLAPGGVIKEHVDPTLGLEVENSVVRLTLPILANDGVEFFLNDTLVPMVPGECWYLRFTDPHRIVNAGPTERINMSIDMIPNPWVRSLILENGEQSCEIA